MDFDRARLSGREDLGRASRETGLAGKTRRLLLPPDDIYNNNTKISVSGLSANDYFFATIISNIKLFEKMVYI